MITILKFFILPALAFLTISLSVIEEVSLRSIYHNVGTVFDIGWMTTRENSPIISDLGHGLIFFVFTLAALASFQKNYWKIIGFILIFAAISEAGQLFIETRQASWQDFLYNLSGILLALTSYFVIKLTNHQMRTNFRLNNRRTR